jgi:Rps23 Pro-64 3,4-dihydroxylase Tpa1-like proline 4-hydroxylase
MKEELVRLILKRLQHEYAALRAHFHSSGSAVGTRYCYVDDLLPGALARKIGDAFPDIATMRLMNSFRERKYTSKNFDHFDPLLSDMTFAFQDQRVINLIESITGIQQQIPDPSLYAGGLSAMVHGHFLGPHIDNSHDASRRYYRTLNLLCYVSPDWSEEFGGNLELWNADVSSQATIVSSFNRLVLMETTPTSWHSVNAVRVDGVRRCISNYYFSPASPTGKQYFNVTSFSARPEQKVLRVLAWGDQKIRQAVRFFVPSGLARKDVYQGSKK